ncbi:hypothetical protein ACH474_10640 [Nocardia rhamnosiphila]|uniref:hypothetical protein n=1 Tax=Nocardia rhamnosiphila TaxID=426716 RepID=UPI0004C4563F|nr:hypothetical protein [Nocardia rhamnosiphila]
MDDQDQYARYAADRQVLRAIGAHLGSEVGRVEVRIPRAMAESAMAAWNRDESDDMGEESREQGALREDAAELALIGLAIDERGVWNGDDVVVDLDIARIAAALRAVR